METRQIWERLKGALGEGVEVECTDAVAAGSEEEKALGKKGYRPRDPFLTVQAETVPAAMAFLRDDPDLAFDFLQCLSAVDYPAGGALAELSADDKLAVVYHLYSYTHRHLLVVKVFVPRGAPLVPTVSDLWPVANWHEREAYDLFGVIFEGHPDLRRIMLPEEFEGHPCLKDYVERPTVMGIPTTRYSGLGLLGKLSDGG